MHVDGLFEVDNIKLPALPPLTLPGCSFRNFLASRGGAGARAPLKYAPVWIWPVDWNWIPTDSHVYVYLCYVMICQVLHNTDAITASNNEWGTSRTCRYRQDWNYQGPWPCTWRHGLCVQLFRADGLPRKIVFVLFIAMQISMPVPSNGERMPLYSLPSTF